MGRFFQNMRYRFSQWMYGRYGTDELTKTLTITALVCIFLAYIPYLWIFSPISMLILVLVLFRTFSKNLAKRRAEREKYLKISGKIKKFFSLRKKMWQERKTHKYFKCPNCKTYLRAPKGRGRLDIGCPKCKTRTIRKT